MRNFSLLTLTILFLSSCTKHVEKYEYYRFSKQVTPSGKYVIYDYARYGSMAFSSDVLGTELFKIDDKFEEGEGTDINGVISEWLSDDTLLVYNFKSELDQPKDTLPIKIKYSNLGDFTVKTIFYKTNAGYGSTSEFDSVKTTNDSIYIRLITDNKESQFLSFPLGATTIKTKADTIIHIEISTRLFKNMNFELKNENGSFTYGLPTIGTADYDLKPRKKISAKGLNKRKIFWEY